MPTTTQKVSWEHTTRLPVQEIERSDMSSGALRVMTPHAGEVFIDLATIEAGGWFKQTQNRQRTTNEMLKRLRDLEWEAKEYLLGQWLAYPKN